jgi:hypothetical protein
MKWLTLLFCGLCIGGGWRFVRGDDSSGPITLSQADYRGWAAHRMANEFISLHVVPEIGGRVMQFQLGKKEFLWVNPQLAGKMPPASGLAADGAWLNYGGDKLWPAPQGWDNEEQWPGPPDAVLDGQPYEYEPVKTQDGEVAVRLTSGRDRRSGIQFSRTIRMESNSTRVAFTATMKNVDTRPRRWGIWTHTQLDAQAPDKAHFNDRMRAWCPLNPHSQFPAGYRVMFGEPDNPSFRSDRQRGLLEVQYRYQVGKIGLDSAAGWVATVDGSAGAVFVQRFVYEPQAEYPDGASVEFWHNGVGTIHAYGKDMVMDDNPQTNPYVFESEVLSPFARLDPGQSYSWSWEWFTANVGGDYPVLACTPAGLVAEPFTATRHAQSVTLRGRLGVFYAGTLQAEFLDGDNQIIATAPVANRVSPLEAVVLNVDLPTPATTAVVRLTLMDPQGSEVGELARCDCQ